MAKETIIRIKTGEAVKSIGELRENIKAYKQQLEGLDIGTQEYQNTLKDLQENQAALRNAMHATTASFQDVTNAATAANVTFDNNNRLVKQDTLSYNELVRELDVLKQQWRATTNAAERLQLGEKIQSVNNKLKQLDSSVGVFGRNVGNYLGAVDHLTNGLRSMGGGASLLGSKIGGVTAGFKALSATPAVAILGVLATVIQKVTDALSTSEENANAMTAALAPFQAIGDAVTNMLQGLGKAVVWVAEQFGKLTTAILGNNEAAEERKRIAEEEADLAKKQRDTMVQNAEAERDIAELRAKATDKLNYSAKERLAFLQEAGDREKEIAERAYQDAKAAYEIQKAKNALTESSAADKEKEAQAYAAMVKAETAYYQQVRTINTGIIRATREEEKAARDAAKAVKDEAKAKLDAHKSYLEQLLKITEDGNKKQLELQNEIDKTEYEKAKAEAVEKIKDQKALHNTLLVLEKSYQLKLAKNRDEFREKERQAELLEIQNLADGYEKGTEQYLAVVVDLRQRAYETLTKQAGESDQQFLARRIAAYQALQEAEQSYLDKSVENGRKALENEMNALREGSVEALEKAVEIAAYDIENLHQKIGESTEDFNARRLALEKAHLEAMDALYAAQVDEEHLRMENEMALLEEGSLARLAKEVELKEFELSTLHQLEGESNEEFRARELAAEKAYQDARKKIWKQSINTMSDVASATSGILGSIADMYEANTEMTKEEAEKAKALRIAGATIDTISGAIKAFMNAQGVTGNPIIDAVIGAASAAAVTLAGITNIAKIKSTQISTSGSGSDASTNFTPAAVSAPTVEPSVTQVRTVTSATEEERLNQMAGDQRVYILDSDLQAADGARKVQVAETTF